LYYSNSLKLKYHQKTSPALDLSKPWVISNSSISNLLLTEQVKWV